MLPPILPLSVVPVTSQQDPARPRPDIPPVVPAQASSGDSAINLAHHERDEAALLLREEQQRHQQQRRDEAAEDGQSSGPASDGTEPAAPSVDGMQRQGLWVDIKV